MALLFEVRILSKSFQIIKTTQKIQIDAHRSLAGGRFFYRLPVERWDQRAGLENHTFRKEVSGQVTPTKG